MHSLENLQNRSHLENLLHCLWEEESFGETVADVNAALDAFLERMETLYPGISRNDDRFFSIITALTGHIEELAYKTGFLMGFSLAQEIDRAIEKNENKNTHRPG